MEKQQHWALIPWSKEHELSPQAYIQANRLLRLGFEVLWLIEDVSSENLFLPKGSFIIPCQRISNSLDPRVVSYLDCLISTHAKEKKDYQIICCQPYLKVRARRLNLAKTSVYCGDTHRPEFVKYWLRLISALENHGFYPRLCTDANLRRSELEDANILLIPGGSSTGKAEAIQPHGMANLLRFIAEGGNYVGICAGMYLAFGYNAATLPFRLLKQAKLCNFDYSKPNSIPFYTLEGNVTCKVTCPEHPIFFGYPEMLTLPFQRGPVCEESDEYTALARFDTVHTVSRWHMEPEKVLKLMKGKPAVVEFPFGDGRVILFAGHPEHPEQRQLSSLLANTIFYLASEEPHDYELDSTWWLQLDESENSFAALPIEAPKDLSDRLFGEMQAGLAQVKVICNKIYEEIKDLPPREEKGWYFYDVMEGLEDAYRRLVEIEKLVMATSSIWKRISPLVQTKQYPWHSTQRYALNILNKAKSCLDKILVLAPELAQALRPIQDELETLLSESKVLRDNYLNQRQEEYDRLRERFNNNCYYLATHQVNFYLNIKVIDMQSDIRHCLENLDMVNFLFAEVE